MYIEAQKMKSKIPFYFTSFPVIQTRFYYGLLTSELLDYRWSEVVAIPQEMIRLVMGIY